MELPFVSVKAGKVFWSWLNNGEEETQVWVMDGIKQGCEDYLKGNSQLAKVFKDAPLKLQQELQEKYNLPDDGSLDWVYLLHAINDLPKDLTPEEIKERREVIGEDAPSDVEQL